MTDTRVEDVIRQTLHDKAQRLDDPPSLLTGVRATVRRRRRTARVGTVVVAGAVTAAAVFGVVVAPGTDDPTAPDGPAPGAGWVQLPLGLDAGDVAVRIVEGTEPPALVAGGPDLFRAWVIGARAEPVPVGPQPSGFVQVGGAVAGDRGLVAVGATRTAGSDRPAIWFSADGRSWAAVDLTGNLDTETVLFDVAATPDGFLAVGGTGVGPERSVPAVWRSTDGTSWAAVPGPAGASGPLTSVAASGDTVVVAADSGNVWVSVDGGSTWTATDAGSAAGEAIGLAALAHGPAGFVISGVADADRTLVVATSPDGVSWRPVQLPESVIDGSVDTVAVVGIPTGFLLTTRAMRDVWDDPARCYAEPAYCESSPLVVGVIENERWATLDLAGLGTAGGWSISGLAVVDDDLFVLDGDTLWRHGFGSLDRVDPATVPTLQGGPPLVEWGAELEVGATYRYPMYTHCGVEVLGRFDGRNWFGVPGSTMTSAEAQVYSTGGFILGELTMVSEDRIEYRVGSRMVGIYEPRPDEPPQCD